VVTYHIATCCDASDKRILIGESDEKEKIRTKKRKEKMELGDGGLPCDLNDFRERDDE